MPYSVNRFQLDSLDNNRFPVNIPDNTIEQTATSLRLLGKGIPNYGEHIAENLVWMLEHFAGPNAPSNPITGQMWFFTDGSPGTGKLLLWDGKTWRQVTFTSVSESFPETPEDGQLSFTDGKLYYYDGEGWNLVSGAIGGTRPAETESVDGELWWDASLGKLYGFDSFRAQWILVGPGTISAGNEPPAPSAGQQPGDLWFNNSNGQMSFYNGEEWQSLANLSFGTSLPPADSVEEGDLFWNSDTQKLWGFSASVGWVLIGPGGTESGTTLPTSPSLGQQFWNTDENKFYVYSGPVKGWVHVGPGSTIRSETPPMNPIEGDIWFDTNKQKGFIWNSVAGVWQTLGGTEFGATAPSNANEGDLWYDTNDMVLRMWDGTSFIMVSNNVPYNSTAPNDPNPGDQWFDTTAGVNAMKLWNGTEWTLQSGVPTDQPTNPQIGDLWYNQSAGALQWYDGVQWNFVANDSSFIPPSTGSILLQVTHSGGTSEVLGVYVNGSLMGVWSDNAYTGITAPADVVNNFGDLQPGLNMRNGAIINGTANQISYA